MGACESSHADVGYCSCHPAYCMCDDLSPPEEFCPKSGAEKEVVESLQKTAIVMNDRVKFSSSERMSKSTNGGIVTAKKKGCKKEQISNKQGAVGTGTGNHGSSSNHCGTSDYGDYGIGYCTAGCHPAYCMCD